MPPIKTLIFRSNKPGVPVAISFNMSSDSMSSFDVSTVGGDGHAILKLDANDGLSIVAKNAVYTVEEDVQIGSRSMSISCGDVTIMASDTTRIKSINNVEIAGDSNTTVSAGKNLLLFGLSGLLKTIRSAIISSARIILEARSTLTLRAPFMYFDGRILVGKGAGRPVARVGDTVVVAGPTGPMVGTITKGSGRMLVGD